MGPQVTAYNGRPLQISQWDLTIESDVSLTGWGISCHMNSAGGPWTQEEWGHHINYLEPKAAFLAPKTFLPSQGPLVVLLRMDNIAFLNHYCSQHWHIGVVYIDLLTNAQLPMYCSWKPDPEAVASGCIVNSMGFPIPT